MNRAVALGTLLIASQPVEAQGPPDAFRIRANVCPFECCTYQPWQAKNKIAAYERARDTTHLVFTVDSGEAFEGVTGNIYIDRFGIVDVLQRTPAIRDTPGTTWFAPGDVLYMLDELGEGFANVLWRDSVVVVEMFWHSPSDTAGRGAEVWGVVRQTAVEEWWALVRSRDGREGWIDMGIARMRGIDACGS